MSAPTPIWKANLPDGTVSNISRSTGESGTRLDLAGNIHEVVTVAPKSEINVGSGTVKKMTVDENAVDSTVTIAQGAAVEELNLDTGAAVTGKGAIGYPECQRTGLQGGNAAR